MRESDIKLIYHRNHKRDKEKYDEDQSCNQQIDIYKRRIDRQLVTTIKEIELQRLRLILESYL